MIKRLSLLMITQNSNKVEKNMVALLDWYNSINNKTIENIIEFFKFEKIIHSKMVMVELVD